MLPAIQAHDKALMDQLEEWENLETIQPEADGKKAPPKGKREKSRLNTDLLIAKNPNNLYPVFQNFKKSEHFTQKHLIRALGILADADMRLKSTSQNPKLVVEKTIIRICLEQ